MQIDVYLFSETNQTMLVLFTYTSFWSFIPEYHIKGISILLLLRYKLINFNIKIMQHDSITELIV